MLASAVLLTVIQPPFELAPLAWVSFVPFILACSPGAEPRRLAVAAYAVSLAYWLANLYWVAPITIAGWVAFAVYTALLWPVLALGLHFCRARRVPLFLAAAVLVTGIERMQGLFLGRFPWRLLAHSQYRNITIIQMSDIFGAGGLSFLVAMVNGLAAQLFLAVGRRRWLAPANLAAVALVSCSVLAAVFYGRFRIAQSDKCISPGPVAAALQSNVPQSLKRTFKAGRELFDDLMTQSKAAAAAGAELIVWPETMVQATLNPEVLDIIPDPCHPWLAFDRELRSHCAAAQVYVLVGAYGGIWDVQEQRWARRYNSAFLYDPAGGKYPKRYDKIHLVPFGEVLPFRRSVPGAYKILKKLTPKELNYDYSLDYGSEYTIFEMTGAAGGQGRSYRFAVLICYEDVVPYLARKFAVDSAGRKRIDFLLNISNDGWFVRFDDEPGSVRASTELAQHAAICAFRAVENRLSVLRSVNTGISCLVDSLGRIRNSFIDGTLPKPAFERTGIAGWFSNKLPIDRRTTFFSKHGQWLDFCCESCVILLIILAVLKRIPPIAGLGTTLLGRSNARDHRDTQEA